MGCCEVEIHVREVDDFESVRGGASAVQVKRSGGNVDR